MTDSLVRVFVGAALPQKLVLAALGLAAVAALVVAARSWRVRRPAPAALVAIKLGAPSLGIATAALNAWHTTHSVLAEPVTVRMLAPGMMEMAVLVWAGALAGVVAAALGTTLEVRARAVARP